MAFSSENLYLTAPAAVLAADVADYVGALTAPTTSFAGVLGGGQGELTAPNVTVAAVIGNGQILTGALIAPDTTVSATLFNGRVFVGDLTSTTTTLDGVGLTGEILSGACTPTLTVCSGTIVPGVQATLTAPAPSLAGVMYSEITWTAALVAPAPEIYSTWSAALAAVFDTWVLNTRTLGASTYTAYPFTSYFSLNGQHYGCAAGGVYRLSGEDDAGTPIAARTLHGISDFDSTHRKRVDSAYLNIRGRGSAQVAVRVDEVSEYKYGTAVTADGLKNHRVKFGRGLEGRNWQLGIHNVGGSRFTLTEVTVVPIKLSRRV